MYAISPPGTHLDSMEGEGCKQQATAGRRKTIVSHIHPLRAVYHATFTHLAAGKAGAFPPLFGGISEDTKQASVGGGLPVALECWFAA